MQNHQQPDGNLSFVFLMKQGRHQKVKRRRTSLRRRGVGRSLGGGSFFLNRGGGGSSGRSAGGAVSFKIRNKLLLLSEHGLEGVELGLELLDTDLTAALGSRGVFGGHPGAEFSDISVEFVPAFHQGGHPGYPLLETLVDHGPALVESCYLDIGLAVRSHLLGGGGSFFEDAELGF